MKLLHTMTRAIAGPLITVFVLWTTGLSEARAAGPVWIAQIVRHIPRTEKELAEAHQKSRNASIQIPIGEPLEIRDFVGETDYNVVLRREGRKVREKLHYEFSRLGVLTYGMNLLPEDRRQLPSVSKRRILNRVDGNYIALAVRVQREPKTGAVYLYYKPFAAVGAYGDTKTHEFSALMEDSVRDIRGIGLFVEPGTPISAESLRTLVAINKNLVESKDADTGQSVLQSHYELLIVRARVDGGRVALYVFGTNRSLGRLNYFQPYAPPDSRQACTIESSIYFTKYTAARQSPTEKALRKIKLRTQAEYPMHELDAYVASQGLEGPALDHLTLVADDIIDGRIRPEPTAAAAGE